MSQLCFQDIIRSETFRRDCLKCRSLGLSSTNLDPAALGKDPRNLLTGDSGAAGQRIALGETEPHIPSDTERVNQFSGIFVGKS